MFSGKLLLFLVSSCLAAPPKLTFPSFSSPVEELIEEDLVQEKVATLTATKDTADEEQKASLKESFLDKHEKFLGLLDFDFFSSAVKTTEPENKDEKQVEKPVSGAGRQAQMANPTYTRGLAYTPSALASSHSRWLALIEVSSIVLGVAK